MIRDVFSRFHAAVLVEGMYRVSLSDLGSEDAFEAPDLELAATG